MSVKSALACAQVEPNDERSERLKAIVRNYFQSSERVNYTENETDPEPDESVNDMIISDVYTMISRYPENNFTGRNLARIFHGVQSPVFPAVIWSRCKYWRAHLKVDFNHIVKLANSVILKMRSWKRLLKFVLILTRFIPAKFVNCCLIKRHFIYHWLLFLFMKCRLANVCPTNSGRTKVASA